MLAATSRRAGQKRDDGTVLVEALLAASPDGILVVDGGGRIIRWNHRFLELSGLGEDWIALPQAERQPRLFGLLRHPQAGAEFALRALASPDETVTERFELADGRDIHIHSAPLADSSSGAAYTRIFYYRDISDLARASATAVVDQNSDPIFTIDVIDGDDGDEFRFHQGNAAFARVYGVEVAEREGRRVDSFLPAQAAIEIQASLRRAVETRQQVTYERHSWPEDAPRVIVTTVTPLIDQNGRCYRLACIARDITLERRSRAAADRLAQIVRASQDAVMSLGTGNCFTSWNRGAETMLGYSAEEAVGQSLLQIVPISRVAERAVLFEKLKSGESITDWPTERVHKDGTIIPVSLSAFFISSEGGDPIEVGVVLRDMRVRHAEQAALESSERQLRAREEELAALFDHSPVGLALVTLESEFLKVNPAAAEIFGAPAAALIGETPLRLGLWPAVNPRGERYRADVRSKGSVTGVIAPMRRMDGETRTVRLSSRLLALGDEARILTSIEDVTEARATELALVESERVYRNLVETAVEGIWVIDAESRTTFVNERLAEILGYAPEEMLGTTLFDYMDDDGRIQAAANVERRREGISELHEFTFRHRDGHPVWTLIATRPAMSDDGVYLGALGMITDISTWKMAEEEARRSRVASAIQAERARIAQELHDDVAQSFFAIGLAARVLTETIDPLSPAASERLASIERLAESGGRQTRTAINALSDDPGPTTLDFAVRRAIELFRQESEIRCSYGLELTPELEIEAVQLLAGAARELLTNVWKHSGAHHVEVSTVHDETHVILTVADDGSGDAAAIQLATSGRASYGLPHLARRISEAGGSFSAEPRDGGGVVIQVTIPRPPAGRATP